MFNQKYTTIDNSYSPAPSAIFAGGNQTGTTRRGQLPFPKILIITLFIILLDGCNNRFTDQQIMVQYVQVNSPDEIKEVIHKPLLTAGDIAPITDTLVTPYLYSNVVSLENLPQQQRKEKFINMILPAILVARFRIEEDRRHILWLLQKQQQQNVWESADSLFAQKMLTQYKADSLPLLPVKMKTHPVSIVLAQAALECGWGTSRFFTDANNIFGIWSYNKTEPRVAASVAREGQQVYVKKYGDLSQSIKDYYLTIARVPAYRTFRNKRAETDDINELIPLLNRYSELGKQYTRRIQLLIKKNDLTRFDHYTLDPDYIGPTEQLAQVTY